MKLLKTRGRTLCARLIVALILSVGILIPFSEVRASMLESDGIQQDGIKIEGRVTDSDGEALIGVSVIVEGTNRTTVTDIDGNFTTVVPKANSKITFSYIGFKTITQQATPRLDVVMYEDSRELSAVVVVGYGTMKKENLTGSVVSVDLDKAIGNRPIADIGRGLQGVAPGLQVTLPSTEIGSEPNLKIRGNIGSIEGSSQPLILLDNVEIPSIQLVNPDDIATISVLKDAASTSIYGSKAAFGVVLITTKKGSVGDKFTIQYSNNLSWQTVDKTIKLAGVEGLEYALDALDRTGSSAFIGAFFKVSRESLERTKGWMQNYGGTIGMNDPMVYGRDWYRDGAYNFGVRLYNPADYMVKDWSFSQNHNLSINGSAGKTAYTLSLGFLDQNSMLKPAKVDDFKRYTANVKLSSELNKYLTIRVGAMYSNRNKRSPFATSAYTADPWYYMYRWTPVMPYGIDEYGDPMRSAAFEMGAAHTAERENAYSSTNLGATINLTSNWDIIADFTYSRNDYTVTMPGTRFLASNIWGSPTPRMDGFGNPVYVNEHGEVVPSGSGKYVSQAYDFPYLQYNAGGSSDRYTREFSQDKQSVWNVYSTYNLKLGDEGIHAFKFMAGTNRVTKDYTWSQVDKTGILIPEKPEINQTVTATSSEGTAGWEAQIGYFGRINYMFDNKYLFEANIRYDGSSKFPKGKKWKAFPSFSVGWIATQEKFMKPLDPVLSFLKARASWGSNGDQSVPSGLYMELMPKSTLSWLNSSGQKVTTYGAPAFVQPSLTWQRIEILDVGFDTRFWNDRIGVTFDWYQKKTKDMITSGATLPAVVGAASPRGNYAELTTKGWELALDFTHRFANGMTIRGGAAIWDAKTVYTDFYDDQQKGIFGYYKGKTYGEIWGYTTDRLFTFNDFVHKEGTDPKDYSLATLVTVNVDGKTKYVFKDPNTADQTYLEGSGFIFGPGDVKYVDRDGSGAINSGTASIDDHGDMSIIGNTTPRYEYSFNLGFDYKGFDLSVYAQGIGKRQMWGSGQMAIPGFMIGDGGMPLAIASNYWTPDRQNAFYPRAWNMYGNNTGYNLQTQTRYLLDMSYLRIKNITLGYTFNSQWTRKAFMNKARIYLSIENLFTFDNLHGLPMDPEVVTGNRGNSMFVNEAAGQEYNSGRTGQSAPAFKTISCGVQITF
ncbi:TonB-linked SusC/RagA family outer membrane protein [Dysgonomonas sp. PFB1-18]|uniref:SusC/RagA family TonB-linked outer membrane protein n=1 Tax=unclassified Dysgonomonas TaxID=2630389 RepID=UPI0024737786|nr:MULTISPECIES: TonB-dependent receptor [unclassified Dysgonomonas]MDH6308895.1 TonB-linked SusC/RagA family outer membrane protein [Dysgonomonas sp. PF1-14]MDH6338646.1 TonB-linked SusC/RagA family outer membrane protein [Dysgonomonas sp. PF1-16]MDH6380326.1 TonB-linked SusC/RagA family outer membrane protein [Dysgonomonas sp. PFB1-18]MDH6397656.1 TonB-linked SusC/RagA family outer membrane protein [Dysgonomonas sp. PF1-23]